MFRIKTDISLSNGNPKLLSSNTIPVSFLAPQNLNKYQFLTLWQNTLNLYIIFPGFFLRLHDYKHLNISYHKMQICCWLKKVLKMQIQNTDKISLTGGGCKDVQYKILVQKRQEFQENHLSLFIQYRVSILKLLTWQEYWRQFLHLHCQTHCVWRQ